MNRVRNRLQSQSGRSELAILDRLRDASSYRLQSDPEFGERAKALVNDAKRLRDEAIELDRPTPYRAVHFVCHWLCQCKRSGRLSEPQFVKHINRLHKAAEVKHSEGIQSLLAGVLFRVGRYPPERGFSFGDSQSLN